MLAHFQHSSQEDLCDCSQVRGITQVGVEYRRQSMMTWQFFKKYMPGFESTYITRTCPEARIGETGHVMGDYALKFEDIEDARKFNGMIGKSAFPTGAKHTVNGRALALKHVAVPKDMGSNDIPYRVLVVKGLENILVAGKAVSADRVSHQRFLQQTAITSQAAGMTAALCVRDGITLRQLKENVSKLQKILISQGAMLYGIY